MNDLLTIVQHKNVDCFLMLRRVTDAENLSVLGQYRQAQTY